MTPSSGSDHGSCQDFPSIVTSNYPSTLPKQPSCTREHAPSIPSPQSLGSDEQIFTSTGSLQHSLYDQAETKILPTSASQIYDQSSGLNAFATARSSPTILGKESIEEPRQIILRAFAPCIAVYSSIDTDNFVKLKGFSEGLCALLRPFGEDVSGRVIIRDSVGGSRAWENFGLRVIDPITLQYSGGRDDSKKENVLQQESGLRKNSYGYDPTADIDEVVNQCLKYKDELPGEKTSSAKHAFSSRTHSSNSQLAYALYLRKLLSSTGIVPYETFSHPVGCIIAISSRNSTPIETLHELYERTGQRADLKHVWMSTEYLRYYILLHDEENDDIAKSIALFDLMKRNFGLHCHLLRLRSSRCLPTDDDSVLVPPCDWLSAVDDLAQLQKRYYLDDEDTPAHFVYESDATAIKGFLREMVTQSIVPFMESRVTTWNDQVGSRRRGISGRLMSLSKRLAGFGSTKANQASSLSTSNSAGSNFDVVKGFYLPDTSEAVMRRLADYAFMLRDWKMAHTMYELLRIDFGNDKAWMYHAAANEMSAVSYLLMSQNLGSKARPEAYEQNLENASYSYLTRCSKTIGAIRCLMVAMELLKSGWVSGVEDAAACGIKLLEIGILTPIAQAFVAKRIADCFSTRAGIGMYKIGSRERRAALWNLLTTRACLDSKRLLQACEELQLARIVYRPYGENDTMLPFLSMNEYWQKLEQNMNDENNRVSLKNNRSVKNSSSSTIKFEYVKV